MHVVMTIVTFLLALGISLVLMPPFISLMEKYRILDKAGGRKIHTGYTAHMGGIIIYLSFITTVLAMLFVMGDKVNILRLFYLGVILTVTLVLGIRDDMHNLKPKSKLFFEILVGIFMSYAGIRLNNLGGFLGIYDIPTWVGYGITTCFFIVVDNSYNLIDGVDGQAGMQAINVFFFCFLFYALLVNRNITIDNFANPLVLYVACLSIIGAIVGFLRYNWQKASIFMGDAGSLFIGSLITVFIISSAKFALTLKSQGAIQVAGFELKAGFAPFLFIFYLPMADTLRVFVSRVRKGRSPFSADKTHIHHLFIRLGYSHQKCTLTTFSLSFCISIVGVVLAFMFNDTICVLIIIVSWFFYVYILRAVTLKNIDKIKQLDTQIHQSNGNS